MIGFRLQFDFMIHVQYSNHLGSLFRSFSHFRIMVHFTFILFSFFFVWGVLCKRALGSFLGHRRVVFFFPYLLFSACTLFLFTLLGFFLVSDLFFYIFYYVHSITCVGSIISLSCAECRLNRLVRSHSHTHWT